VRSQAGQNYYPPGFANFWSKEEVVLVGGLKLFEIWDRERWEEEFERAKRNFPQISQALSGLGI
jgi:DNA-binding transcriptional regulator/RsmH inhibitor MraZ